MTTYTHSPRRRIGMLAATAAAATVTAAVVSTAPAQATCASFFGLNAGSGCSSTLFSVAIAIGNGATATASSAFGTALALGTGANAIASNPFSFGIAAGDSSTANAGGLFAIAVSLGTDTYAGTAGSTALGNLGFNIALNVSGPGDGSGVQAEGVGNIAAGFFDNGSETTAGGSFSTATNFGGRDTTVTAGNDASSAFNTAFNILGRDNDVDAGPGPFALAGAILQTGANIAKTGPGININGFTIGGTAATRHRTPSSVAVKRARAVVPVAATGDSTPKPVSAVRARR